jgi:riboflavin synthase
VFTGIVRELGRVDAVVGGAEATRLRIRAPETAAGVAAGDSVSVNGVCLTVVEAGDGVVAFDVVAETLRRSTLDSLEPGARANVEPALRAGDALGGHFVQGHVDGVGRVRAVTDEGIELELPRGLARYAVEKGSIALDGVSLTVAGLGEDWLGVALVPHTKAVTTLGSLREGDAVNVEVDVLAKYVEKLAAR